ncbi:SUKH-3 domain-containing protein [Streptomyces panaciradicis]|uniref:SUKH-3 domain-containing protein n=1 Tax=Streptomyces panaciradicis TaxID=1470261 RepID=UPI00201CB2F5|nr:SUKH-3 domain-containing protein [Streptomyces panaciradicis]MCL6674829.1 SUKH-3 domain-containing protein [Streptomyces panaciradicis]
MTNSPAMAVPTDLDHARHTERPDNPREAGLRERLSDILAEDARWVASAADVRRVQDVWDELGIHCSPTALRFVEEFNGSGFDYPRHPLDPGTHRCELNAERASRIVNGEKLREYEQRTGERLTPVGTAASGPLVLLVAEGGRTYGAYDAFLALYGRSPEEALVHLVDRVRPERLD